MYIILKRLEKLNKPIRVMKTLGLSIVKQVLGSVETRSFFNLKHILYSFIIV